MQKHCLSIFMLSAAHWRTGCSTQAWYNGLQASARASCQQRPSSEQARGEARLNQQPYDAYEKGHTAK